MQPQQTLAQKSAYVQNLYRDGHSEHVIASLTGYSLGTVQRYVAPAKRTYALELFNFGFTEREIAAQIGYKPETVRRILRSAPNENALKVTDSDRLGQGIAAFVNFYSDRESRKPYQHKAMGAFRKVKLPKIIAQAVNSLNLGELAEPPKDPYEILLFQVMRGGFPNATRMGQSVFTDYISSQPQQVSVDGLVSYLKQGIVSAFRDYLKFPVRVDKESIDSAIESLTTREREVIRKRIFDGRKLGDIAGDYHVTRERIRQNEAKALRKLRRQPAIRLAEPERLYNRVKSLEGIVEQQKKDIQLRDATIAAYEARYGLLPGTPVDPGLKMKLDTPIDVLEISVRAYNCIRSIGIIRVGELVQKTEEELLKNKNIGKKSLNEIKQILAEMGLQLGMTLSDELAMQHT